MFLAADKIVILDQLTNLLSALLCPTDRTIAADQFPKRGSLDQLLTAVQELAQLPLAFLLGQRELVKSCLWFIGSWGEPVIQHK